MQARWFAVGDQIAAAGITAKEVIARQYLRKTTVFPGTQATGTVWFRRHKALDSGVVNITIGTQNYEFSFPPPALAKAPTAQGIPVIESSKGPSEPTQELQEPAPNSTGAAFGIVVRTSEDADARGLEILDVAYGSPAEAAGLHAGYVITSIDGKRMRTTNDLVRELGNRAPDAKVRLGYMFRSAISWMGNERVVALGPTPASLCSGLEPAKAFGIRLQLSPAFYFQAWYGRFGGCSLFG